jgi:hypothetical protein
MTRLGRDPRRSPALLALLALGAACSNKLSGEITVDGKPLAIRYCRSGEAGGFHGVDFVDTSGRRLRLVGLPTGQVEALWFDSGAATAIDLGICGALALAQQNSTINDVRNVRGKATLACTSAGHAVKGELAFENCH